MEQKKNLVEELLLEKQVIDPNKLLYSYFYEDVEWFAYKLSDDTMMYVSYELIPQGIGRAYCITVQCLRFSYDITSVYYSKSFTNDSTGEWTNISSNFQDKLVSDAMKDLNVWGNQS